jgi:hypothetical protein
MKNTKTLTEQDKIKLTKTCFEGIIGGTIITAMSIFILFTEAAGAAFFTGPIGIGVLAISTIGIIVVNKED